MGLLNTLLSPLRSNQVSTKEPSFVVSNYTSNSSFNNILTQDSNKNYLDQYILYVYKSIEFISESLLDFQPYIADLEGEEIENNDLMRDLKHFNNYQTYTQALKLLEMHLRLTGVGAWVMQPSQNPRNKVDFFPLDPTKLSVKTDSYGLPAYYAYEDGNGTTVNFSKDEVIYFWRPNPKNWFEGYSQLEPVKYLMNAYNSGSQMNMNRMLNGGMPDFLLYFENISEDTRERLDLQLKSKYGGVKNAGRQGVIDQKPEKIELSSTNKELDYIEGMKMLRQDILTIFGVPEALVFPSSTNANTKESLRVYQQNTLKPALRLLTDTLNEQLIPKYYGGNRAVTNIQFVYDDPVDQDRLEDATIFKLLTEGGMTINQASERVGWEPVEGGDVVRLTQGAQIVEQSTTNDDTAKYVAELSQEIKSISSKLNEESKKTARDVYKEKALKQIVREELSLIEVTNKTFEEQASRWLKKYDSKKPTLRSLPDLEEENNAVAHSFKLPLLSIIGDNNNTANVEIRQKLYKVDKQKFIAYKPKSLSPQSIQDIEEYLQVFANEINTVTIDKFKTVISNGIQNGIDSEEFKQEIANMFNGFTDGVKNTETLKGIGVYVENIKPDGSLNTGERYKQMLIRIQSAYDSKEITLDEYNNALKALRGVIDVTDPMGAEVDQLLTNIYAVPREEGITEKRVNTIAKTTATYARNLGREETYKDNPFVTGKEWISVADKRTRDTHRSLDGDVVPLDQPFTSGSSKLMRPGDTSLGASASETINCRCLIVASVE